MGVTNLDALTLSGNAIIGGTLSVTGASTINGVVVGATETLAAAGAKWVVIKEVGVGMA